MEYGNGRATMIELDMIYVSYFGDFLSIAAENLSNKIFCLGLVRQEKPAGRQEKSPGRPESLQARPGPYSKVAANAGLVA
jgi:hypothetical protein